MAHIRSFQKSEVLEYPNLLFVAASFYSYLLVFPRVLCYFGLSMFCFMRILQSLDWGWVVPENSVLYLPVLHHPQPSAKNEDNFWLIYLLEVSWVKQEEYI